MFELNWSGIGASVGAVALLRCGPAISYAMLTRSVDLGSKFALILALAGCAAWVHRIDAVHLEQLAALGAWLPYFLLVTYATHGARRHVQRMSSVSRLFAFIVHACAWIGIPALLQSGSGVAGIILFAVDPMLSAWSLAREADSKSSRKAALFFVFVDPVLVWTSRAKRVGTPELSSAHLLRMAIGGGFVCASVALTVGFQNVAADAWLGPLLRSNAGLATYFALAFYAGHSGIASLQIGTLAALGYRVPERYVYPVLARDLADFWRRWNTYLGAWLHRYVFLPASSSSLRSWRPSRRQGLSIVATFVASGLLHTLVVWVMGRPPSATICAVFALHGCLLVVLQAAAQSTTFRELKSASPYRVAVRIASLAFLVWSAGIVLPALS